ncbi:hypothetical protein MLD38_008122 [Melastoma candidum]|uniref:Uncharacterized protein n=1 Tax=Melastoma candidum TaxID=119954 RepID=A0ACB9RTA3_9MYRT|nr:hypothetical protein MLD38_008122 [Melastoma candidum]
MDQRKVNVLAREYCDDIKRKNKHIIFVSPYASWGKDKRRCLKAEVNVKIKKAYCPPKIVEGNLCLEYVKFIIFPWFNEFKVERSPDNGGDKVFTSFDELVADYESGNLHPGDLKPALSKALNKILQPVRDHFTKDAKAKDLLKRVKAYRVTR